MAKSMLWISTRYPPIKGMTVHTQTIPEGTGLMLRRSILPRWLIPLALFLCASSPLGAQYLYLDEDGNGVHDAGDVVCLTAGAATIDIWLDTSINRDGSPAVCATGPGAVSFNSYEVILHATGGVVSWGPFTNQMPGFGVRLTRDARDTTEVDYYHNGWSGGATSLAGRYRLGTITVTPVSGDPAIDVVAAHPGYASMA